MTPVPVPVVGLHPVTEATDRSAGGRRPRWIEGCAVAKRESVLAEVAGLLPLLSGLPLRVVCLASVPPPRGGRAQSL